MQATAVQTPMDLPRGFGVLIAAQFCSALADNALLIVAIALLVSMQLPPWWAPLLKFSFTVAYVVLAPGVGPLADRWPKARIMMAMNAVKVVGVALLLWRVHPLAALGLVGMGAAAYAPAKYGLVTELVGAGQLVRANAWIEVSTVCAVLLGTALGGLLVSPALASLVELLRATLGQGLHGATVAAALPPAFAPALHSPPLHPLDLALWALLGLYGCAALLNLGVPDSGARYARTRLQPQILLRTFRQAHRRLWADAEAGLSMAVTTLFWGAAAVLQFAVLRWATVVLGLGLDRAAYLQAVVALGIIAGAAAAGRWVPLMAARRVLPLGVVLGLLIPAAAMMGSWQAALPLLLTVGALGGALVVPLNALLQHRGHQLTSAGCSIAVQNFNENFSVLVALAVYATLLAFEVDIRALMSGLGLCVAGVVAALQRSEKHRQQRAAAASAAAAAIKPAALHAANPARSSGP